MTTVNRLVLKIACIIGDLLPTAPLLQISLEQCKTKTADGGNWKLLLPLINADNNDPN